MSNTGWHHLAHFASSTANTMRGLVHAASSETSFKQEILALLALPVAARLYGLPHSAIILIIVAWLFVMALELLNIGIEAVCDLVSPEFHPLVKIAKDAGSAAVGVAIFANALLWAYLAYMFW